MARERSDTGQVILLAGVLLVIAFILFSIRLSLLTNLGQQVGREAENPLLEDFLLARRTLETLLPDEAREANGTVRCPPDPVTFTYQVNATLLLMAALEENRGQSFTGAVYRYDDAGTTFTVGIRMALADAVTTVSERVEIRFTCVNY